jgi:hypothetical protein
MPNSLVAPEYRNSTANKILPKVTNAGMVGLAKCCKYQVAKWRSDYERSASYFQTVNRFG